MNADASSCSASRNAHLSRGEREARPPVRIAITGAAGMLGRKLVQELALGGVLAGRPISHITLFDVANVELVGAANFDSEILVGNIGEIGVARTLVSGRPDVIFHLAAVVSGEAEADFDKGYRVNVDGTRHLFDAIRAVDDYCPRVVFTSSLAVFGPPMPDVINDDHCIAPQTSYGMQKAVAELLLGEYTRRGYLDGVAIRLPTICVRPGKPNQAASSFFSSIIREPLNGQEAILPVSDELRHWFASPRVATNYLIHAATIDGNAVGGVRCLNMPGVSATVAMQITALYCVGGECAVRLIRREPNESIERIVANWPRSFNAARACALGFRAESDFEEIVRVYIEDELGGLLPAFN